MPSDNSCLFTAFGGALPQQVLPSRLRQMMADYIRQHLDIYSEAILGVPPERYCQTIVDPDRWGGGIELSILSSIFDIKICTYDVQVRLPTVSTNCCAALMVYRRKISFPLERKSETSACSFTLAFTMTVLHSAILSIHMTTRCCLQKWTARPGLWRMRK